MKKILFIALFTTQFIIANNLTITNVTKVSDSEINFDISWDNSWTLSSFKDEAWVFIKYKNTSGQWRHLDITTGTRISGGLSVYNQLDHKGIILSRRFVGTGTVSATIRVTFNSAVVGPLPDFKVFGIEMVYINPGAFYVGDGAATNRFHQGNDNTQPFYIQSSNAITVGNTSNDIDSTIFEGAVATIPSTYPKGYRAFHIMKYEITQEQYVEFLNTLTPVQQQSLTKTDLSMVDATNRFVLKDAASPFFRNGIACDANVDNTLPITFYCDLNNNGVPNEADDGQNIACNLLSSQASLAYLDWAALRPITDFEYEKACRGAGTIPIAGETANGTALITPTGNITNGGTATESFSNVGAIGLLHVDDFNPSRVGATANATTNRLQSGASFYGVMGLTGNIAELTVSSKTVYNLTNFSNSNRGDGELSLLGFNNTINIDQLNSKGGSYYNTSINPTFNYNRLQVSDNYHYNVFLSNSFDFSRYAFRGAR